MSDTPGTAWSDRIEMELDRDAVHRARGHVADFLARWAGTDEEFVYDAQLVVTELVANAVRHAGTALALELSGDSHHLVVAVRDGSSVLPERRTATDRDEDGRGLLLISALSQAWGVESLPGGHKRVWARMARVEMG